MALFMLSVPLAYEQLIENKIEHSEPSRCWKTLHHLTVDPIVFADLSKLFSLHRMYVF